MGHPPVILSVPKRLRYFLTNRDPIRISGVLHISTRVIEALVRERTAARVRGSATMLPTMDDLSADQENHLAVEVHYSFTFLANR